jgi:hypothetical protein
MKDSSATFSACRTLRYHLMRGWDPLLPPLLFDMLNPSKAGEIDNDPTIRKACGFSMRLGFGSTEAVNLSPYIATDPRDWKRAGCPVDSLNLSHVIAAALRVTACGGKVVCAWGANARGLPVAAQHLAALRFHGITPYALRLLDDGTPAHPLMLPYSCQLVEIP